MVDWEWEGVRTREDLLVAEDSTVYRLKEIDGVELEESIAGDREEQRPPNLETTLSIIEMTEMLRGGFDRISVVFGFWWPIQSNRG